MAEQEMSPSTPPKKKPRSRNCTFNDSWLLDVNFKPWIAKASDNNSVRCIVCERVFSIRYDGIDAVKQHAMGKKHILAMQSKKQNNIITKFFPTTQSKEQDVVTATELTQVFHTVKHHHSYLSADCGAKLHVKLFPDSQVASKVHLGRTKMECLVENVLAPFSVDNVIKEMQKNLCKFSVATDASNKGNRKFFPLAVRFFSATNGINDRLLDFYEEPDESSESVCKHLVDVLSGLNLDLKNMIAYTADNASVNYGKNCSVYRRLKDLQPSLIKANCNCHVLHNTARHALKVLSFDVENLVLKVFNEFSSSAKNVTELKSCFEFVHQEYHNVLRHVPTRWLSLFAAVDRLLLNWESIKVYFLKYGKVNCHPVIWSFIENQEDGLSTTLTLA